MKLTAVLSLKDNYTDTLKRAVKKTEEFRKEIQKTKAALDDSFGKKQTLDVDVHMDSKAVADAATKQLTKVQRIAKGMLPKMLRNNLNINFDVNIMEAYQMMNTLWKPIRKLTKAPFTITFKMLNMVSGPLLSGVKGTAAKIKQLIEDSLKGAASSETMTLGIEHSIKLNRQGLSTNKVKEEAASYINAIRTQSEVASFDMKDVQEAGAAAISVAKGDAKEAVNLLRLAGDMAAVTPGQTLKAALDALAELKTGDGSGLKEFGFDVNEGSIPRANHDLAKVKNKGGVALETAFKGGGNAAAETASGLWTSIKNSLKINVGIKEALQILKPELKNWADFIKSDGFKSMFAAGSKMMSGIALAITQRSQKIRNWLQTSFFTNEDFKKLSLGEKFKIALDELQKSFNGWYEQEGKKFFSVISKGAAGFAEKTVPILADIGVDLGKALASGMVSGLSEVLKDHPFLSSVALGIGATAVGGPTAGLATFGTSYLLSSLAGVIESTDERRKQREIESSEMWRRMENSTPEDPFLKDTTWGGRPEGRTVFHDIRDKTWGYFIDKGWMDPPTPKPHAFGLRRVPYDNYPALLHQNERVLTAQEARSAESRAPVTINLVAGKQVDPDLNKLLGALRSAVEASGFNLAAGGAA